MSFTFAGRYGPQPFLTSSATLLPNDSVTVYLLGTTTKATLYTDRTKGTTAANPFTTDKYGNGSFWADPGDYTLSLNGVTVDVQVPIDPGEPSTADVASFNGRHGAVSPASGDYTAAQVTNVPAGGISATTVQAAANALDVRLSTAESTLSTTTALVGGNKVWPVTLPNLAAVQKVQRLGAEVDVYTFCDLGAGTVLASTDTNGAIYRSTNYGRSWTLVTNNAGGAATLHDIVNLGGGVVLGATDNACKVARSTDNGSTWTNSGASPQLSASFLKVNCFCDLGGGHVLAGTYNSSPAGGYVFSSTDYGATWNAGVQLGAEKGIDIILNLGGGIVIAGAQDEAASNWFRSTDSGVTWTRITSGLNVTNGEYGHCGAYLGGGVVVIGTYGGGSASHLYRSTDYGQTWTTVVTSSVQGFFCVTDLGGGVVMAGSGINPTNCKIMVSLDFGVTWSDYQTTFDGVATHVLHITHLGSGVLLVGLGTTGEVWRCGPAQSFNGRSGDITPQQSDYDSFFHVLLFGDKSDGSVHVHVNDVSGLGPIQAVSSTLFQLNRDAFFDSLTLDATVVLNANGYRLFCRTLTLNGSITMDGGAGGNAVSGGAVGAAGSAIGANTIGQGNNGGAGGGAGAAGAAGGDNLQSLGGDGGAGGAGAGGSGGAHGTATALTAAVGSVRSVPSAFLVHGIGNQTLLTVTGGAGGGGGAGGAGASDGRGGGGGAAGGSLMVAAHTLINNGAISANGGNGGNGAGTDAGGGGGGGGGLVIVICQTQTGSGTITAAAGVHGTGTGTGSNGVDGAAGTVVLLTP